VICWVVGAIGLAALIGAGWLGWRLIRDVVEKL